MSSPTSNRIALNALWIALSDYGYPFDEWVRDEYAAGADWPQLAEEVRVRTQCPIQPDGWEPSRPTLSGWYPDLRRLAPTKYAKAGDEAAA